MNLLITGAAGIIGYHLSKRLLADGHGVSQNESTFRTDHVSERITFQNEG